MMTMVAMAMLDLILLVLPTFCDECTVNRQVGIKENLLGLKAQNRSIKRSKEV